MEQIQQQLNGDHHDQAQDGGSKLGSNYLCRQSSTRWTPTTEQIKILKDLYYNNGVRSPTADQIQNISARLRKFGKIEGKNVFYWFQNHKARERQKKRFTEHNHHHLPTMQMPSNIIYPTGISCPPSAAGVVSGGQMVGGCGYGHMSMESNFRECTAISTCAGNCGISSFPNQSFQWAGVDPYIHQSYSFLEGTRNPSAEADHHEFQFQDEDQEIPSELETLPLFPMHAEDQEPPTTSYCGANMMMRSQPADYCYTSLELSLNSNGDQ